MVVSTAAIKGWRKVYDPDHAIPFLDACQALNQHLLDGENVTAQIQGLKPPLFPLIEDEGNVTWTLLPPNDGDQYPKRALAMVRAGRIRRVYAIFNRDLERLGFPDPLSPEDEERQEAIRQALLTLRLHHARFTVNGIPVGYPVQSGSKGAVLALHVPGVAESAFELPGPEQEAPPPAE